MKVFGYSARPLRHIRLAGGRQWLRPRIQLLSRSYASLEQSGNGAIERFERAATDETASGLNPSETIEEKIEKVLSSLNLKGTGPGVGSIAAELRLPDLRHARPVPSSPSYFSRATRFNDMFVAAQDTLSKHASLPTVAKGSAPRMPWMSVTDHRGRTGEPINAADFGAAIGIVKRLNRINPGIRPPEVNTLLQDWVKKINPWGNKPKVIPIDKFGRAVGTGKRKTAIARAWVVEGTGEVQINGKNLVEVFGRVHDRESALWALMCTERMDKYNVWALVKGGGPTGQAEALAMAVARALVAHEPALKTTLRKAGCITRDPREVERKKAGHRKARKMPAWVKR